MGSAELSRDPGQVGRQVDPREVAGLVEGLVQHRHRLNSVLHVLQHRPRGGDASARLKAQEAHDDLQVVLDSMVDLLEKGIPLAQGGPQHLLSILALRDVDHDAQKPGWAPGRVPRKHPARDVHPPVGSVDAPQSRLVLIGRVSQRKGRLHLPCDVPPIIRMNPLEPLVAERMSVRGTRPQHREVSVGREPLIGLEIPVPDADRRRIRRQGESLGHLLDP